MNVLLYHKIKNALCLKTARFRGKILDGGSFAVFMKKQVIRVDDDNAGI